MSDLDIRTNSCIELSEIRKLDNLLTQCESSSCENICMECCESLGNSQSEVDHLNSKKRQNQLSGGHLFSLMSKLNRSVDKQQSDVMETNLLNQKHYFHEVARSKRSSSSKCNSLSGSGNDLSKKKQNFESKRYFSLDKDRLDKDKQQQDQVNNEKGNFTGGSENYLCNTKKHCSFDRSVIANCDENNEGAVNIKLRSLSVKRQSVCICDNCERSSNVITLRSPSTSAGGGGGGVSFRKCKDTGRSIKSSQTSLKDNIKSLKSSNYDVSDRDSIHESLRSKFSPQALARKISARASSHHHDQDHHEPADKEALLGHKHHEKKLPEPVETVGVI